MSCPFTEVLLLPDAIAWGILGRGLGADEVGSPKKPVGRVSEWRREWGSYLPSFIVYENKQ